MYLIDTNVISEAREQSKANPGVRAFFAETTQSNTPVFLTTITIGELRRGVPLIRRRADTAQADLLEAWLTTLIAQFAANILPLDLDAARIWGRLRVPDPAHAIDKQIAAIGLVNDLTLVTRNTADFTRTGVRLKNPFHPA